MNSLFSDEGLKVLKHYCAQKTLFAFDYDGTLSPYNLDIGKAVMRPATTRSLETLSQLAPVAVVSGRKKSDILSLIKMPIPFVVGNHGVEGVTTWSRAQEAISAAQTWTQELEKNLTRPEVFVEQKLYTLSVHYQKCSEKLQARQEILNLITFLVPAARIILGKDVVNLTLPNAPHKGDALLEVMKAAQCEHCVYVGDDDTDEDVFSLSHADILKIRVGMNSNSRAVYYISNQNDIDTLLDKVIKNLASTPAK